MALDQLEKILKSADTIVFFGGAGVSTESGIPDFRGSGGLYGKKAGLRFSPEEILSLSFFVRYPEAFYDFYRSNMVFDQAKPNKAHLALAKWEAEGRLTAVVTQNIDGLHQQAGSRNVMELHGSVHRNYCMDCKKFFSLDTVMKSKGIPRCDLCNGIIKPDVVLYEESLRQDVLESAASFIEKADVLLIGGTSLSVYPAAGLINCNKGGKLVLINQSPTRYDQKADLVINGKIAEILGFLT